MQSPFDYKLDWNLVKWKAVAKGNVQRHYSNAKTSSSRLNVRRFLKLCNYYYYHRFSILHQPVGCRHGTVSANTNNNIQSTPTHDYDQNKAHPVICYSLFFLFFSTANLNTKICKLNLHRKSTGSVVVQWPMTTPTTSILCSFDFVRSGEKSGTFYRNCQRTNFFFLPTFEHVRIKCGGICLFGGLKERNSLCIVVPVWYDSFVGFFNGQDVSLCPSDDTKKTVNKSYWTSLSHDLRHFKLFHGFIELFWWSHHMEFQGNKIRL